MDSENELDQSQPEATEETLNEAAERTLKEDIENLQAESESLRDQLLRTMADFQNFRKRQEEQRIAQLDRMTESVMLELIPVVDNFERTLKSIDAGATLESIREGMLGVERQIRGVLSAHGVQRLETLGKPFDPDLHEALAVDPTNDVEPDTITVELEAGYTLNGRTIRPARVKVAKPE